MADDFTGTLESVAPFASLGVHCVVATSPDDLTEAFANAPQVLAINLGSHEAGPDHARRIAVATAIAALRAIRGETIWFKKIDSRMKGQIAAEVTGVLSVVGTHRLGPPPVPRPDTDHSAHAAWACRILCRVTRSGYPCLGRGPDQDRQSVLRCGP